MFPAIESALKFMINAIMLTDHSPLDLAFFPYSHFCS